MAQMNGATLNQTMTRIVRVRDVAPTVRSFGLTCKYDAAYQEWRIDYKRSDSRWSEDSAYYTTYPDDAIDTARQMATFQR